MPKHVIEMLDDLLEDGTDEDTKVLGAAMKASLGMLIDCKESLRSVEIHVADKDLHTAKGLLVNGPVIKWFVFLSALTAGIITYMPDLIKWLAGLP